MMSLIVAAIGATVAGLLELTVVPYVSIAGAHPHPVLVLGIVWVVAAGFESGMAWAFVGGLVLDVLALRPMGSTALAMLASLAAAAAGARLLSRLRPLAPIPLAFVLSLVYSTTTFYLVSSLGAPLAAGDLLATLLPGATYDAVLAAVAGPLVVSLHDRATEQERVDW